MKERGKTHLIVGEGEIGSALKEVLSLRYPVQTRDSKSDLKGSFSVLHVCYPPIKNFVEVTREYAKEYDSELVIIHGTVAVGTTAAIGKDAVHSPVRGTHPHLAEGMKTFVKYFGGPKAEEAAAYFKNIGIPVKTFAKSETTELAKILDTSYYGWNILFAKEVKRVCEAMELDFEEVYTIPNRDYNEGYKKLGRENVVRPVLNPVPGKIGGHCIIPNTELLDDWLTNTLKNRNKEY